jgi:hypothetical protein
MSTEGTARSVLLVGSMPFEDEEACMRQAIEALGPHLRWLPDGEIGEKSAQFPQGNRIAWVMYAIEELTADADNWEIVTAPTRGADGMAVDYDRIQKLRPRRRPAEMPQHVSLGYDEWFARSYPIFRDLRAEHGLDGLSFQVGVPSGMAMSFAFARRLDGLRYIGAFNEVIAREVDAVVEEAGDDVVVQIEIPPELYAAYALPSPLMAVAMRPLRDLLSKIRRPARLGIHLCLGDFHNEALTHPKTLGKMVEFSNRMVDGWDDRHTLEYVHFPFAEGAVPPPTDPEYYRPLGDVRLPGGTRFVAGFVHDRLSFEENRQVLEAIETVRGGPVDVAASCGLGRRTPEEARLILDHSARLAVL